MEKTCTCDSCTVYECAKREPDLSAVPDYCPMLDREFTESVAREYADEEVQRMYIAAKQAGDGTRRARYVPRYRRLIDLCKNLGYRKIGLSYCAHFKKEAEQYAAILRRHGIEVVSACCTEGKLDAGLTEKLGDSACDFTETCNPIGLAKLMNREKVDFNFVMGLCTGVDSLFYRAADAMCTGLVINDPPTGHTPTKALYLYNTYYDAFFTVPNPAKEEE